MLGWQLAMWWWRSVEEKAHTEAHCGSRGGMARLLTESSVHPVYPCGLTALYPIPEGLGLGGWRGGRVLRGVPPGPQRCEQPLG